MLVSDLSDGHLLRSFTAGGGFWERDRHLMPLYLYTNMYIFE